MSSGRLEHRWPRVGGLAALAGGLIILAAPSGAAADSAVVQVSSASASAWFESGNEIFAANATQFFTVGGAAPWLPEAGSSRATAGYGSCLSRDDAGNCTWTVLWTCYPDGAAYGSGLLSSPHSFSIDRTLDSAALRASFTCIDPSQTHMSVEMDWTGSGTTYTFPMRPGEPPGQTAFPFPIPFAGHEAFREEVTMSGTFIVDGVTHSFPATSQGNISLWYRSLVYLVP